VPEPGDPQSLNRYSYVNNNPVKYSDPTGRFKEEELLGWGISQEQIAKWKQSDLDWWSVLQAAHLYDLITALNPFTSGSPKQVGGHFVLAPDWMKAPQRLTIDFDANLEGFRQTTTNRQVWRLNASGEMELVPRATQFLSAQPHIPTLYLTWNADQVNWDYVKLDAASVATAGMAKWARVAEIAIASGKVNAAISGRQAALPLTGIAAGQIGLLDYLSLGATASSLVPGYGMAGSLAGLAIDLSAGIGVTCR